MTLARNATTDQGEPIETIDATEVDRNRSATASAGLVEDVRDAVEQAKIREVAGHGDR